MLRYALLRHECPLDYRDGPHWDLMLELPGVADEHRLATWSLLKLPTAWGEALSLLVETEAAPVATRLDDHRAAYLDYEGPVSNGRGVVRRVAGGSIEWKGFTHGHAEVKILTPTPLAGILSLSQSVSDAPWRLNWLPEEC